MIGTITGIVDYQEESLLIVDVHGVGYSVLVSSSVSVTQGDQIKLFTHTHVREDVLELYGFSHPADLKLFKYLISVSGVGCKTALMVFSVGSRSEIIQAITTNDVGFFTAVPRLGKKNAQKIIIELKNKLGGETDLDLGQDGSESIEVIAALQALGFTPAEARSALKGLHGAGATSGEKVKLALRALGK